MQVTIITIGDELLIGQVVDTNSALMAKELNQIGLSVKQIYSISDDAEAIKSTLDIALYSTSIVLLTGGLGPTKDDITKHVLAEYFGTQLVFNPDVLANVERLLLKRLGSLNKLNQSQAMVPESCKVLINEYGTAPAMWFEKDGKIVVSMAGVPFEMEHSMKTHIIPTLKERFQLGEVVHKTLMVSGYPESVLSEFIEDIEDALPETIKLAYLPSPGIVRLRLSSKTDVNGVLPDPMQPHVDKLYERLGDAIFAEDDEAIEAHLGTLLKDRNLFLGTAESCTGGSIGALVTSISGSSQYFAGSVVAYQNAIKERVLGVSPNDLEQFGAVSEAVVKQMVLGALESLNCDIAVSTSGIAGPTGGTEEKPVGTVWIAVGNKNEVVARKFQFSRNRVYNIRRTAVMALIMVKDFIEKHY